ncbi:unnamed protein product [Linum trigynum]|uniref:Alpha-farnesene synthase n=1 Tax=Linum trigynum TaxID=586398 RepID=A0AAV2DHA5_9ROSI
MTNQLDSRRSANYKPNIWEYGFLQSLSATDQDMKEYELRAEKLKEEAKFLFAEAAADDWVAKLELIDSVRKLGLDSFFEDEIKEVLDALSISIGDSSFHIVKRNLHFCALSFRLLRQCGYRVSQDMFIEFMDKPTRSFMESKCCGDVLGLVELFEASYLGLKDEDIMEEANRFSTRVLKSSYPRLLLHRNNDLAERVAHALELPIHWRVRWFDVKWQIKVQKKKVGRALIDLAKVNFNVVQSVLQRDLKKISRWWKDLGLIERLDFTRDRVVESFLCSVGLAIGTEFSGFRIRLTKIILMILVLDDVYDVYGSIEELHHFTTAIDKWNARELEELPEPMKLCFQALTDITEEISVEIQNERGWDDDKQVQPHLQRVWGDFCQAMLVEAKWCRDGRTPSLKEYLTNGSVSSSGTVIAVHSFCSVSSSSSSEMKSSFLEKSDHDLIHNVCLIIRLCNDVGTSKVEQERGEAASSIACYMREADATEEEAKDYVKGLIAGVWKKINEQCFGQPPATPRRFVDITTNMARVAHNLYQDGDGFGGQDHKRHHKKQILSLLVHPLSGLSPVDRSK